MLCLKSWGLHFRGWRGYLYQCLLALQMFLNILRHCFDATRNEILLATKAIALYQTQRDGYELKLEAKSWIPPI